MHVAEFLSLASLSFALFYLSYKVVFGGSVKKSVKIIASVNLSKTEI
jgi:hypothetical protein